MRARLLAALVASVLGGACSSGGSVVGTAGTAEPPAAASTQSVEDSDPAPAGTTSSIPSEPVTEEAVTEVPSDPISILLPDRFDMIDNDAALPPLACLSSLRFAITDYQSGGVPRPGSPPWEIFTNQWVLQFDSLDSAEQAVREIRSEPNCILPGEAVDNDVADVTVLWELNDPVADTTSRISSSVLQSGDTVLLANVIEAMGDSTPGLDETLAEYR